MPDKYDSLFMSPGNDDFMALLEEYAQQGRLPELFQPFSQEQGVLSQEMAMAEALRRPGGRQYSSPWGAALGGLADAVGNVSGAYFQKKNLEKQGALGGKMQSDAAGRMEALINLLRRRKEMEPDPNDAYEGLEPPELME